MTIIYRGFRDRHGAHVHRLVGQSRNVLRLRLDLDNHSPTGFNWGSACLNDDAGNSSLISSCPSLCLPVVDVPLADRSSESESTSAPVSISRESGTASTVANHLQRPAMSDGKTGVRAASAPEVAPKSVPSVKSLSSNSAVGAIAADTTAVGPHCNSITDLDVTQHGEANSTTTSKYKSTPSASSYSAPTAISRNISRIHAGESQLALALLADVLNNDVRALKLHQEFKWRVIAPIQDDEWRLTPQQIIDHANAIEEEIATRNEA